MSQVNEFAPKINGIYQLDSKYKMPFGKYKEELIEHILDMDHGSGFYFILLYKHRNSNYHKYIFTEELKKTIVKTHQSWCMAYLPHYKIKDNLTIDDLTN